MSSIVDRGVDRLMGRWVQRDLGGPVTLADDVQHRLVGPPL
ncbi:MAG TPA: hypothetical protein VJ978_14345 [Nitriliruptoraceae bacterium]|nr:hypothetical protein [Nitriliruptoraceae bacterium]